jgi:hypothetical protein
MLQALAAPWLVGDFKTWNGKTDAAAEAERIALLSAAFDEEDPARAAAAIAAIREVYPGVRALVVASGEVEPPLDTPLEPFDAVGLRAALAAGLIPDAQRVASGPGRLPANATDADRQACSLSLWMLGATEDDGGDRS